MKKCPNCGTILDDSKKKCYMCGSSLDDSTKLDFASAFEAAISSKVSDNVDNVFNNGEDIKVKSNDVVKKNTDGTYFNNNGDFKVFSSELDKLTSIKTEKMTEKESAIASKRQEKNEKRIEKAIQKQKVEKKKEDNKKQIPKNGKFFSDQVVEKTKKVKKVNKIVSEKSVAKPEVKKNISKEPKTKKEIVINKALIFNLTCVLIFIGLIIFALSLINNKKSPKTVLGGLSYIINSEFKVSSNDGYSKFYTYGDNCSIRLSYGNVTNTDGFLDNYFETQRKYFENEDGNKAVREKITINDNVWDSMKIVNFSANTETEKVVENIKYRYNAIIYQGNFYYIVFVNSSNGEACNSMYDQFIDTLNFDE